MEVCYNQDVMKLKMIKDSIYEETEVILKYAKKDDLVQRIVTFLESADKQIDCFDDRKEQIKVNISDIYYIESIDKKTFVYLADAVYQTDWRLYQLLADLQSNGFVQINRACLLNISVLEKIRPLFNSRMEATLLNGEKVIVNRSYLDNVKSALRGEEK